ncbi:hypothetical protein Sjap_003375 [Stephania japonica]|uniref:Uncharacterized protein n=1 Tax=Stephania japonica TaxID=461633 RepID=A0AAP0KRA0_9MAGN
MCYVGKATKIFIFIVTVLVVVGLLMGFGLLRHHNKAHKCAGGGAGDPSCYQPPPVVSDPIPATGTPTTIPVPGTTSPEISTPSIPSPPGMSPPLVPSPPGVLMPSAPGPGSNAPQVPALTTPGPAHA